MTAERDHRTYETQMKQPDGGVCGTVAKRKQIGDNEGIRDDVDADAMRYISEARCVSWKVKHAGVDSQENNNKKDIRSWESSETSGSRRDRCIGVRDVRCCIDTDDVRMNRINIPVHVH